MVWVVGVGIVGIVDVGCVIGVVGVAIVGIAIVGIVDVGCVIGVVGRWKSLISWFSFVLSFHGCYDLFLYIFNNIFLVFGHLLRGIR